MEGDTPQRKDNEIDTPMGDFYLYQEVRNIREENALLRDRIAELEGQSTKVKTNSRQLGIVRFVLVVALGAMAIASAWDIGENNQRTFHGERWQAIIVTVIGALGAGALGLGDRLKEK